MLSYIFKITNKYFLVQRAFHGFTTLEVTHSLARRVLFLWSGRRFVCITSTIWFEHISNDGNALFSLEPAVPTTVVFKHFHNYWLSLLILLENYSKEIVCIYSLSILFQGKQEDRGVKYPFRKVVNNCSIFMFTVTFQIM